ncbi:4Fe-4S dicluster domain-containing protein [Patescibacteria group bacterium]
MNNRKLKNFLKYLQKDNRIIAPSREGNELVLKQVENFDDIELTNEIPLHSFKKFLVPDKEVLEGGCFKSKKNIPLTPLKGGTNQEREERNHLVPLYKRGQGCVSAKQRMVLFGVNAPDLKAITILNHIFEKDPSYQKRIKNFLTVGYASFPSEYKGPLAVCYEEHNLEHFQFDIFIIEDKGGIKIFTGSEDGQRILDNFGYSNYENVQFAGLVKEEGPSEIMKKIKSAIQKLSPNSKIFQDLGKKCIECGRCSLICPLCYCFCLEDGIDRERILTSCFYSEFSEVAGGQKFLKNPAERIYNWYEHKFVRFPDELSVPGCVSCGRCAKVCPVGIDIKEVIKSILSYS